MTSTTKTAPQRDSKGHFIKKDAKPVAEAAVFTSNDATPTLPILAAVNGLVADIRYHHPDLPLVTIVLGAPGATRRGMIHGHFFADKWQGDAKHEILLSGESLQRGAAATLGTLLHESAHAIAHARGVKDTSNNGRYHNKRFKAIAEELGIELESAPTLGWSLTSVPESTLEQYKDGIEELAKALTTYRVPAVKSAEKKVRNKTKTQMDCGCEDPVTVSIQWFERHEGSLKCDDCLEEFRLVDAA